MSTRYDDGHSVVYLNVMSREVYVYVWSHMIIIIVFPCFSICVSNQCVKPVWKSYRIIPLHITQTCFNFSLEQNTCILFPSPDLAVSVFLQARSYLTPGFTGTQLPALRLILSTSCRTVMLPRCQMLEFKRGPFCNYDGGHLGRVPVLQGACALHKGYAVVHLSPVVESMFVTPLASITGLKRVAA